MKKRFLAIAMTVAMVVGLSACSGSNSTTETTTQAAAENTTQVAAESSVESTSSESTHIYMYLQHQRIMAGLEL